MIVGAGPRLGESVARRFGRDGYDVALIGRDESRVAELGARLAADGITASWAGAEVGDSTALTDAVTRLAGQAGGVDVLLHNVSAWRGTASLETSPDELLADLAVGHREPADRGAGGGAARCAAAGHGTILATGSTAADHPQPGAASLSVQKAALRALVQVLDADLRSLGIHCATITVRGAIKEGTALAPERIADLYAELVAETTAGPPATWRTVVDLPAPLLPYPLSGAFRAQWCVITHHSDPNAPLNG